MPKDVANHIIICNWNERGKRVITELRHPESKPDTDIVIVTKKSMDEKGMQRLTSFHKVYCINEDPIRHGTLKAARVGLADTIIVLSDDERVRIRTPSPP